MGLFPRGQRRLLYSSFELLVFAAAWRGPAMPCAFGAGPGVCGRGCCPVCGVYVGWGVSGALALSGLWGAGAYGL